MNEWTPPGQTLPEKRVASKEAAFEKRLSEHVKKLGGEYIKLSSIAGIPDRMILLPGGKVYFLELKRAGQTPTPRQLSYIEKLKKLGFDASWTEPVAPDTLFK